jgi:hypothetical protein
MAQLAAAALYPVDVQVMKVLLSVPEAGCEGSVRIFQQVPVMAAETQFVLVISIWRINVYRKLLDEQFNIYRTMRVVTICTLAVPDRPVLDSLVLLNNSLMTVEAQFFSCFRQELFEVIGMGRMAGSACLLRYYRGMDRLCIRNGFAYLRMALEAELCPFR